VCSDGRKDRYREIKDRFASPSGWTLSKYPGPKARAESLSSERRSEIEKAAAATRWRRDMQIELEALKKRLYVDNKVKNVKFYPGSNSDAGPEDIAREINKFFADPEGEEVDCD
jgi:hypothetical protein